MNYTSMQLMALVKDLESTIETVTLEQRTIFDNLYNEIKENGRFYEVAALTVESMREHGYDVTEDDAGIISAIAEKTEMDPDDLWNGVEIWANHYGVKQIEDF